MQKTLYASFDVEADGPCPQNSNMVELGVSFLTKDGEEIDHFYSTIERKEGYDGDVKTIEWLKGNGVWERVTAEGARDPRVVMEDLSNKIRELSEAYHITWVAYPAAYDWQWIKWYWEAFVESPEKRDLLGYYAICVDSIFDYYVEYCAKPRPNKTELWNELANGKTHTHNALDDAREQGTVYINLLKIT